MNAAAGIDDQPRKVRNPFTPSWGIAPMHYVGRDEMVSTILEALESGPLAPAFTTLLLGARGSGKTATLRVAEGEARKMGWYVIAVDTIGPSLEQRIKEELRVLYEEHDTLPDIMDDKEGESSSTEFRFFRIGKWRHSKHRSRGKAFDERGLRFHFRKLARHAARDQVGVLLTLDEIHDGDPDQLRQLFSALQFVTKGDRLPLAFLGAGLPQIRDKLFRGYTTTFIQRCHKERMEPFSIDDAANCLKQ